MQAVETRELKIASGLTADGVVVTVADSGPGLPPEVASRLFHPFVSTKENGMGVGLSICRTMIEAHGGRIWADANDGGGTIFNFTLPFADLEAAHAR